MNGRHVTDPGRQITGFRLYELADGGWRAEHVRDPELAAENTDW